MGVAKTSWQHGPLLSVLASNDHYCHPAKGVFDTNSILLSIAICVSLSLHMWLVVTKSRVRLSTCIDYITVCSLDWLAVTNFKTIKIKFDCFL